MSILPILGTREVMRRLTRAGFLLVKIKGSHHIFLHPATGRTTSVPLHGGKTVGRNLLAKIIKQAGLTTDEFLDL